MWQTKCCNKIVRIHSPKERWNKTLSYNPQQQQNSKVICFFHLTESILTSGISQSMLIHQAQLIYRSNIVQIYDNLEAQITLVYCLGSLQEQINSPIIQKSTSSYQPAKTTSNRTNPLFFVTGAQDMAAYHFSFYYTTCNISPRIHNPFVSSYLVLHLQMSLPLISTRHLSGPLTGPHRTANMM